MHDDFTDYDDDFEAAPEKPKSSPIPNGNYNVELTALELGTADSGDKRIEYTFKIIDGEKAGLRIWKKDYLPPARSNDPKDVNKRSYIMGDVKVVGGEIKFSEFMARMREFEGGKFEVTVKHKDKYQNVYINKRLDAVAVTAAPLAPAVQPALPGVPAATTPFD